MIRHIFSRASKQDECARYLNPDELRIVPLIILGLLLYCSQIVMIVQGQTVSSQIQSDRILEPGARIESAITTDDIHYYRVRAVSGYYLRLEVEQRGVEVTMALLNVDGDTIAEADSAGTEYVSVISPADTTYRIAIRGRKSTPTGRYLIGIENFHLAVPSDWDRIAAEKALQEGTTLSRRRNKQDTQMAIQKFQESLKFWQGLPYKQKADQREGARTLYLLALRNQDLGEPQNALNYCFQALAMSREAHDPYRESATLNTLGALYYSLGDKSKALGYYEQASGLSRLIEDRSTELASLLNIGVIYKARGERERAIEVYNKVLPLAIELKESVIEVAAITNLARLHGIIGERAKSLEFNLQALRLWRELENPDGEATTLKNLGSLYESSGELEEAQKYYEQALELSQKTGDLNREAHIWGDLARVNRDMGRLNDSGAQIERSLSIFESLRLKLITPDLRSSFLSAQREYYEFYVSLLMQQHKLQSNAGFDAKAFQVSERARARSLVEMLAEAQINLQQELPPSLIEREQSLRRMIRTKELDRLKLIKEKSSVEQRVEIEKTVLALTADYEQLQTEIRLANPHLAALTHPQPLTLREIQQQILDPDTLLLEYSLGEDSSYLWAVTATSLHSFKLPGRKDIEDMAQRYYEMLTARGQKIKFETQEKRYSRIALADQNLLAAAKSLSKTLLGPASGLLGNKRLLIVPDGTLHYIPFGSLPVVAEENADNGRSVNRESNSFNPLIVAHEIVNLPSASSLAVLRKEVAGRKPAPNAVAVMADPVFDQADERIKAWQNTARLQHGKSETPFRKIITNGNSFTGRSNVIASNLQWAGFESDRVSITHKMIDNYSEVGDEATREGIARLPHTRREAQAILSFASGLKNKVALDFDANRASATSPELGRYRYLHFATHGLLNDSNPALSGLALSLVNREGAEQNGFLYAMDIINLKLPVDLVVLSGCRTGLGKEVRGEGLIGLTRSFMYAGAARVMVSLWNINDQATAELMTRFYHELLINNERPASALRLAQISLWKDKRWQSPYYWSAFVLQGEPR